MGEGFLHQLQSQAAEERWHTGRLEVDDGLGDGLPAFVGDCAVAGRMRFDELQGSAQVDIRLFTGVVKNVSVMFEIEPVDDLVITEVVEPQPT